MTNSFVEQSGHDESNIKKHQSDAGLATNSDPFITRDQSAVKSGVVPDVGILNEKGRRRNGDGEQLSANKLWSRPFANENREVAGDPDVGILDRGRRGEHWQQQRRTFDANLHAKNKVADRSLQEEPLSDMCPGENGRPGYWYFYVSSSRRKVIFPSVVVLGHYRMFVGPNFVDACIMLVETSCSALIH